MKSILEGRPALKAEIDKIAEVAGYLWQNGWAGIESFFINHYQNLVHGQHVWSFYELL